jgi:hypothetical protein
MLKNVNIVDNPSSVFFIFDNHPLLKLTPITFLRIKSNMMFSKDK